jgi:inosose dehydratase
MRRRAESSIIPPVLRDRVAAAPISWGVCEVPGWGRMLSPDRVLSEMASLGFRATELGPVGYLPLDAGRLREVLEVHGLELVGGFVPLVLHEGSPAAAEGDLDVVLDALAGAGADVAVVAAVMDGDWSAPAGLEDSQWARLTAGLRETAELAADRDLELALHPHAGTLIESAVDIERVLDAVEVGWCLDTGHLAIGGVEPAEFVRSHAARIVHVHLKDVDLELAASVAERRLSLVEAVRRGLFLPLGEGGADIEGVVRALDRAGYSRWLVLEQDTAISGGEPSPGAGPILDVRRSIEFLRTLAPRGEAREEVRS